MMDKQRRRRPNSPPPCHDCRACIKIRLFPMRSPTGPLLVALGVEPDPGLNRLLPAWECDLRKYETVEDIEKEEKS